MPKRTSSPSWVLFAAGVVLSASYITFIVWVTDLAKLRSLPPNELGDFLAGAFAPLAFLWLVLGFIQQGAELRQNSEALLLQAQELAESARQQRELVAATRDQLSLEREVVAKEQERQRRALLPIFIVNIELDHPAGHARRRTIYLTNVGAEVKFPAIQVLAEWPEIKRGVPSESAWKPDQRGSISYFEGGDGTQPKGTVRVHFTDKSGERCSLEFELADGVLRQTSQRAIPATG